MIQSHSMFTLGHFKENQKDGFGKETDESGVEYEGQFEKDQQHGAGLLRMPNGIVLAVTYNHGICTCTNKY